jgi:uncharacterized protein
MDETLFKSDNKLEGLLIGLLKEPDTYLIRFPYTKDGIWTIKSGGYIAVENFHSETKTKRYSVLEMTKVSPVHYALGSKAEKLVDEYYGFVEVAARSLSRDWEQEEPEEEVTRIQVEAKPVGIMIEQQLIPQAKISLSPDRVSPLLGAPARILTDETVSKVINQNIRPEQSVSLGNLLANENVPLQLNASKLCSSHLGLFGFTRSGKSNLTSNLVQRMLCTNDGSKKVIMIDYTNEYFGLLADCFMEVEDSILLILDSDRLQEVVGVQFNDTLTKPEVRQKFANHLVSNMTLQDLSEHSEALVNVMEKVLESGHVKVYVPLTLAEQTARKLYEVITSYPKDWLGRARPAILSWYNAFKNSTIEVKPELLDTLAEEMETGLRSDRAICLKQAIDSDDVDVLIKVNSNVDGIKPSQKNCMNEMVKVMKDLANNWIFIEQLNSELKIGIDDLSKIVDDKSTHSLIIATSEKTDDLASFFADFANRQYKNRRRTGTKEPSVLFFLDEADEFIPSESDAKGVRAKSRAAAEMLARRSGKFAMGIGLATQRVAYMDTKVIGQLHTYFVSKLPRKSDRAKVAEAFGIETDHIDRTLQLNTGEWMVISHSALGIPITPFLAKFPNAEDRVVNYLKEKNYLNGNNSN